MHVKMYHVKKEPIVHFLLVLSSQLRSIASWVGIFCDPDKRHTMSPLLRTERRWSTSGGAMGSKPSHIGTKKETMGNRVHPFAGLCRRDIRARGDSDGIIGSRCLFSW